MIQEITSYQELEALVVEMGFLPFFRNAIPGFSVQEYTPLELWFPEDEEEEGPWDWKGPVARGGKCVYGKLFCGKAGFVSLDWYPELANYRRGGYDFDARFDDGLAALKDKQIVDMLALHGSLLSRELKAQCGYGRQGKKGFDTVVTRLQMQTYVNIADFEYMADGQGNLYGWGVARYTTPEAQFGSDVVTSAYLRTPEVSWQRMISHLAKKLPGVDEAQIARILK